MSRLSRFLLTGFLLLAPFAASAAWKTTWDFTGGQVPGKWEGAGWGQADVTPGADGARIAATSDGRMMRPTEWTHPMDVVTLSFAAARQTDALFLWHGKGNKEGEVYQLPFSIPVGNPSVITLDMTTVAPWDRRSDRIGFALPAGADVTLQRIDLQGWNPLEKAEMAWKSFWMFDTLNNTSINFLWGPLLRFGPVTRAALFSESPPQGWSANRVFYGILVLTGLLALAWRWKNGWTYEDVARSALFAFLGIVFGLWIFYDIRMGAEFLSYAKDDWDTYLSRPAGERTYRRFDTFYDALQQSLPVLQARREYGFLFPDGIPLESRARYFTYPSLNVSGAAAMNRKDLTTWFVFLRPDVTVDDAGRLLLDGTVLAESGAIVKRFGNGSFLYAR